RPSDHTPRGRTLRGPFRGGDDMAHTTVAGYLLHRLMEWEVDKVFAYPGDGINGIVAAWSDADPEKVPKFIQSRHEEMSAFEAVGHAKFTGRTSVCMATSGPGAVHLLNGLYDAKLDRVPVGAIIGQTARTAIERCYLHERDLQSPDKDVASEHVQTGRSPQQRPTAHDRTSRAAETQRAPTAAIIPLDVQEAEYSPPTHDFKLVPSSLGYS